MRTREQQIRRARWILGGATVGVLAGIATAVRHLPAHASSAYATGYVMGCVVVTAGIGAFIGSTVARSGERSAAPPENDVPPGESEATVRRTFTAYCPACGEPRHGGAADGRLPPNCEHCGEAVDPTFVGYCAACAHPRHGEYVDGRLQKSPSCEGCGQAVAIVATPGDKPNKAG